MAIFSQLTKPEIETIYDYIYLHGSRSGCTQPIAPITKLLKPWEEAKEKYLYQLMGGNFILSKEISFQKSLAEIEDTIRENVTGGWHRFYDNETPCKTFLVAWQNLANKLSIEKDDSEIHWALSDLVSNRMLASNRYDGIQIEIPLPNDKKYRLLRDAKVSKAIGKIATAYSLPGYEEFRIAHSQALNEKSLTGEICMSIHPMDYMTMSDNDCGWGSCMSWYDHGDFRQGTVEMMNSPMVVVVYLKSSTDFVCNSRDNQTWNSKRWRELFIVTPDIIAGIKGYPYWNPELESIALEWIKETVSNSGVEGFGPYGDNIVKYDAHNNVVLIDDEHHITLDFRTNLMYNDFYEDHQMFVAKDFTRIPECINYSGMSECMSCGDPLTDWESESDLFCPECDPVYRCCECGDWHSLDDLIEVDGELYCSYCYDEYIVECADCGNPHHYQSMEKIYIAKDESHVCLDKEIVLDDNCISHENFFNESDIHTFWGRWHNRMNYVLAKDLTPRGLEAFGFDSLEEAMEYDSCEYYDAADD